MSADDYIDREKRAGEALRAYPGYTGAEDEDIEEVFIDLMADLLLLARSLNLDPDNLIETAKMHYDAETGPEAGRF